MDPCYDSRLRELEIERERAFEQGRHLFDEYLPLVKLFNQCVSASNKAQERKIMQEIYQLVLKERRSIKISTTPAFIKENGKVIPNPEHPLYDFYKKDFDNRKKEN